MSATAQTSTSSTPTSRTALDSAHEQLHSEASEVSKETQALLLELRIQKLIGEVKAGREVISRQREELAAADSQLSAEKENSASLERSKGLANVEIGHLRTAIGYQSEALNAKSETIAVLKERNGELKREASKNRKRALWASAASVALGAFMLLK